MRHRLYSYTKCSATRWSFGSDRHLVSMNGNYYIIKLAYHHVTVPNRWESSQYILPYLMPACYNHQFNTQLMFTVPQATDRGQVRTPNCLFTSAVRLEVPWGWHRCWHVSCCLLCQIWFTNHINIEATEEETNVWYNRSINCLKFWEACLRNTMILRTGRVRCFWFNPVEMLQTGRHAKLVLIQHSAFILVFLTRSVCKKILRYPTPTLLVRFKHDNPHPRWMRSRKTQRNWLTGIYHLHTYPNPS